MHNKINTDTIRLRDIINAITDIEDFMQKSSITERMTLMATAYEIAIIGEAADNLSDDFHKKHNHIPWKDIIGMRHRIIHGYGKVNIERLKEVVEHHLPVLKLQIINIINNTTPQTPSL